MGPAVTKQERTPLAATKTAEPRQPTASRDDRTPTTQQRSSLPKVQTAEPTRATVKEDEIRLRAYEIYLQRGGESGDEFNDWIQAERELRGD